ncbi:MAG: DUF58 domain-containing protein [Saprospiraceae bacterium]|nr:DUF58 domain-containing protein [Saprospiraceae bacterium]
MDTQTLLKKVRRIEIKTRGLSKHLFSGEYHSAFKGRGMSFSEVRDYSYGDDVRNIDWNVTARSGTPFVKVFEEERELTMMLMIDVSASNFFATRNNLKVDLYTEIAAVLAFSAIQNNDKVGLILFSDKVEKYIPPKKGKQHILRIIRELINFEPDSGATDVGEALRYFNNVIKKRSICFIMSDFIALDYDAPLKIASKRHDIIGLRIYDRFEASPPKAGLIRVQDPESGTVKFLDLSSSRHREMIDHHFQKYSDYYRTNFPRSGADMLQMATDDDYVKALLKFFKRRHS